MKTDLERFIDLYRSFGIELVARPNENGDFCVVVGNYGPNSESGWSDKFGGYSPFYSTVEFDKAGTFVKQDFWE